MNLSTVSLVKGTSHNQSHLDRKDCHRSSHRKHLRPHFAEILHCGIVRCHL